MRPLAALLLLAACTPDGADTAATDTTGPSDTGPEATGNYTNLAATDGGAYWVSYATDPSPIPLNAYFDATFAVFTDEAMTAPASGVIASFAAAMPAHGHGMNVEPTVTDNGDGTFAVQGILFHMEGDWQMVLSLSGDSGVQTATFDVDCCR